MEANIGLFTNNVALLRGSASRHAYLGTLIALCAVLIATALTDWLPDQQIALASMWLAQKENVALWLLDLMPFAFAVWGQYFSVVLSHQAGALIMDQTEELRADNVVLQMQARNRSHLDRLTGLPNRDLFLDRADQAVQQAHAEKYPVGALVVDLDDFTEVNEAMGQHSGDRLLQSVGKRLRGAISEPATVARLSADSFAILLPRIPSAEALLTASRQISKALEPPFALENVTVAARASVGGAIYPEHALDAETLLSKADQAMHQAKASAGNYI